jgi:hypothetical protein
MAVDSEAESEPGGKQGFIIQIHFCRYSTWQGTIQWLETGKNQNFRSALELIKLIDSADKSQHMEW